MEIVARSAQVLIALGGAYVVAFWFVLVVWTFRDIEARSRSVVTQVVSTLMVVLFFVPGVLLYMILRPKETLDDAFQRSLEEEYLLQDLEELPLCPACHRYVEDDFVLCPHCHAQLREPCVSCARLVDLRWPLCPYCATVQHGRTSQTEQVEAPAARWTAPNVRRRRVAAEAGVGQRPAVATNGTNPPGLPAETVLPLPVVEEHAAADASEPRSTPFTIVSGMRSMVRPLDRVFGRESKGAELEHVATNGNGAVRADSKGFDRRNGAAVDAEGGPGQELGRFGSVDGNGHRDTSALEPTSSNGFHRDDGERYERFLEEEQGTVIRETGDSTAASEDALVRIPGRRR